MLEQHLLVFFFFLYTSTEDCWISNDVINMISEECDVIQREKAKAPLVTQGNSVMTEVPGFIENQSQPNQNLHSGSIINVVLLI